jgi:hypothetical protein
MAIDTVLSKSWHIELREILSYKSRREAQMTSGARIVISTNC